MTEERCNVVVALVVVCGNEATHRVTAGCVHEHVKTWSACTEHTGWAQDGRVSCGACWHQGGALVIARALEVEALVHAEELAEARLEPAYGD